MTDRSDLPKRGDRYVLNGGTYRVTSTGKDGEVSLALEKQHIFSGSHCIYCFRDSFGIQNAVDSGSQTRADAMRCRAQERS